MTTKKTVHDYRPTTPEDPAVLRARLDRIQGKWLDRSQDDLMDRIPHQPWCDPQQHALLLSGFEYEHLDDVDGCVSRLIVREFGDDEQIAGAWYDEGGNPAFRVDGLRLDRDDVQRLLTLLADGDGEGVAALRSVLGEALGVLS